MKKLTTKERGMYMLKRIKEWSRTSMTWGGYFKMVLICWIGSLILLLGELAYLNSRIDENMEEEKPKRGFLNRKYVKSEINFEDEEFES